MLVGWRSYFALLEQKPISNAVDASNFVLQGMGHPTHAFDLDKIEGGIIVRLARKGERIKLLDGIERTLEADDLVVADHAKALGLAGVMGGWDSMITAETKNILVEAAWFDPASVRRSARRHGLHTDASHRFERGADLNACATANALVAKLILESGGAPEGELVDVVVPSVAARTAHRPPIALSLSQVQRHLGTTLDDKPGQSALTGEIVRQYLTALGCELTQTAPLSRSLPSSCRAGGSTWNARSTWWKKLRASTATTALPTRCPRRCPSSRTRLPPRRPQCVCACWRWAIRRRSPAASRRRPTARPSSAQIGKPLRAVSSNWRIRSPTRRACCDHRWRRE